jgi:hypothetical protein
MKLLVSILLTVISASSLAAAQTTAPSTSPSTRPSAALKPGAPVELQQWVDAHGGGEAGRAALRSLHAEEEVLGRMQRGRIDHGISGDSELRTNAKGELYYLFASARARANAIENQKLKIEGLAIVAARSPSALPPLVTSYSWPDGLKVGLFTNAVHGVTGSVVDEQNLIMSLGWPAQRSLDMVDVWLTGIDTKGLSDGREMTIEQHVLFVGTRKYTAVSGAQRTVLLGVVAPERWVSP